MASNEALARRRGEALAKLGAMRGELTALIGVEFPERRAQRALNNEHFFVFRLEELVEDLEIVVARLRGDNSDESDTKRPPEQAADDADGAVQAVPEAGAAAGDSVLETGEGATAGTVVVDGEGVAAEAEVTPAPPPQVEAPPPPQATTAKKRGRKSNKQQQQQQ